MTTALMPDVLRPRESDATARGAERILILGMTPLAQEILHELDRRPNPRFAVIGALADARPGERMEGCRFLGDFRRLQQVVAEWRPTRVVVALNDRHGRIPPRVLLEVCALRGIAVEEATEFYERLTGKVALESLTPGGILFSWNFQPSRFHLAVAWIVNVVAATVALIGLSPLLALVAAAIKIDSAGPVFFVQERVGARGRPFKLLKFRTMSATTARRSEWAADNRDHVTRVGKWLRKFRLDELPQFINVLRREMNLVGPRPHPVTNLELLTLVARNLSETTGTAVACYTLRLIAPPGLTGWAQVRYRYANNLAEEIEKLRYDLYYVKHMSPWLDFRILIDTVRVIVEGRGADDAAGERVAIATAAPFVIQRDMGTTKTA